MLPSRRRRKGERGVFTVAVTQWPVKLCGMSLAVQVGVSLLLREFFGGGRVLHLSICFFNGIKLNKFKNVLAFNDACILLLVFWYFVENSPRFSYQFYPQFPLTLYVFMYRYRDALSEQNGPSEPWTRWMTFRNKHALWRNATRKTKRIDSQIKSDWFNWETAAKSRLPAGKFFPTLLNHGYIKCWGCACL